MIRRLASMGRFALVFAAVALAGCDTWFGGVEDPPLPGERISVLVHQRTLLPDADPSEAVVLPPPEVNAEWTQPGGTANHAMHHLAVADVPRRAWRVDIGEGASDGQWLVASPVVGGGRLFVIDADHDVSAYDAADGERLWRAGLTPDEEDDDHMVGGLAYEGGRVFVATGFAQVVALDAADGAELWRASVDGPMRAAPTVRGGRVFVVTLGNRVIALNAYTGDELWSFEGLPEVASLLGGASPAVDGGVVVAPFSSGDVVAFRASNGRELWTDSLGPTRRTDELATLAHIRGRPIIDRGRVYAVSHGGLTAAIDARTGRRVWDREIGGLESPWIAGDYLYVLTNEAELVCLSRQTGGIVWVTELPAFEDEEEREGLILWTGPVLVSDRLLIASSEGEIIAVSPYSGRMLGRLEVPDGVSVPPVVANGTIYFLTDDGAIVAFR